MSGNRTEAEDASYLSVAIVEVVQKIAKHRVPSITQQSKHCSLASAVLYTAFILQHQQ